MDLSDAAMPVSSADQQYGKESSHLLYTASKGRKRGQAGLIRHTYAVECPRWTIRLAINYHSL